MSNCCLSGVTNTHNWDELGWQGGVIERLATFAEYSREGAAKVIYALAALSATRLIVRNVRDDALDWALGGVEEAPLRFELRREFLTEIPQHLPQCERQEILMYTADLLQIAMYMRELEVADRVRFLTGCASGLPVAQASRFHRVPDYSSLPIAPRRTRSVTDELEEVLKGIGLVSDE